MVYIYGIFAYRSSTAPDHGGCLREGSHSAQRLRRKSGLPGAGYLRILTVAGLEFPKGPIIDTAIIAATMAAKKTSELIPFCHPLALKSVKVKIDPCDEARLRIVATVKVNEVTGVEMEALTAASVAALTLYDMCKAASKAIVIEHTRLLEKTGGKSDYTR